jgi:L-asparagine transporter-like permease
VKHSYSFKLSIFSIIVLAFVYTINSRFQFKFQNEHAGYAVMYMFILTILTHLALLKTFKERPQAFVYRFMGFSGMRLVLHFLLLIIYWFIFKDALIGFTVQFLALYLLFTSFEIFYLYRDLKSLPKNQ